MSIGLRDRVDGFSSGSLGIIRPNSAAELVTRLEELGLARRAADPADSRRVQVELTGRAEAVLHDLSAAHLRELAAIRPALLALLEQTGPG
jgi:DNA-binding MarR family transcriptional regulator